MKNILRIPRLYDKYSETMREVLQKQKLNIYLESKSILNTADLAEMNKYEQSCVKAAMNQQFYDKLDLQRLKDSIMHDID